MKIEIDILDEIDKKIQKSLDTLKESLGELLPTKHPKNSGREKCVPFSNINSNSIYKLYSSISMDN